MDQEQALKLVKKMKFWQSSWPLLIIVIIMVASAVAVITCFARTQYIIVPVMGWWLMAMIVVAVVFVFLRVLVDKYEVHAFSFEEDGKFQYVWFLVNKKKNVKLFCFEGEEYIDLFNNIQKSNHVRTSWDLSFGSPVIDVGNKRFTVSLSFKVNMRNIMAWMASRFENNPKSVIELNLNMKVENYYGGTMRKLFPFMDAKNDTRFETVEELEEHIVRLWKALSISFTDIKVEDAKLTAKFGYEIREKVEPFTKKVEVS